MDSSTLGYWLRANSYSELICLTFDYGQKQIIELKHAAIIAKKLGAVHHIIDISYIKKYLSHSGSSLTNPDIAVPHGEYTFENMQSTVVPNRNSLLLTTAWTIACIEQADVLAYGAHTGDHYIYPDTRPEYLDAINTSLRLGTEGSRKDNLKLIAPFINWSKSAIVQEGARLGVPFELTWTCYEGGDIQCGLCGACVSRKKAFADTKTTDPIIYKD